MSKMAEAYYDNFEKDKDSEGVSLYNKYYEEMSRLTEKEKCLYYGKACSFGICSECDIAERS